MPNISIKSSRTSKISKLTSSNSISPASILEKSKISLMMESSASPERLIVWVNSICSSVKSVSANRLDMPITPFKGVRISWLMVDKNSDLALEPDSASSFAVSSSFSYLFCLLIFLNISATVSLSEVLLVIGEIISETGMFFWCCIKFALSSCSVIPLSASLIIDSLEIFGTENLKKS